MRVFRKSHAVIIALLALACIDPHQGKNIPPTVCITAGPYDVIASDSCRFAWVGSDRDGEVTGYYYGLGDTAPGIWIEDTTVILRGLALGPQVFQVRAVDDSGALSTSAARSFWVDYDSLVAPRGTDTTFEIATWNIQNFPKLGDSTVNRVRALMARLDLDAYALQEIEDTLAFRKLVAGLAGYDGVYSRDSYGSSYQKTGVVFRTSLMTVSRPRHLFWGYDSVVRPPIEMDVVATHNGRTFDFRLIVLHLKAGGSSSDFAQRRATCRLLKQHIDAALAEGPELDFLVVGDWNDQLEDAPQWNAFQQFLDDSLNYRFLTRHLAGNTRYGSYIPSGGLIDHIMVTADALAEYAGGRTETLRLDDDVNGYLSIISDHRPVMAVFPVFSK